MIHCVLLQPPFFTIFCSFDLFMWLRIGRQDGFCQRERTCKRRRRKRRVRRFTIWVLCYPWQPQSTKDTTYTCFAGHCFAGTWTNCNPHSAFLPVFIHVFSWGTDPFSVNCSFFFIGKTSSALLPYVYLYHRKTLWEKIRVYEKKVDDIEMFSELWI